jgi:hypothetical protein
VCAPRRTPTATLRADLVVSYAGDQILRTERDTNFDGVMDAASKVDKAGLQTQGDRFHGDGRVDTWSAFDSAGSRCAKRATPTATASPTC